MLQTFLTGLREGLEAALVVSILMSFMVRSGHRDRIPALWAGVAVAVLVSFGFGALLHYTSASMSFEAQEAFGGILSIIAVVFVTWMVFWMKRASRTLKGALHDKMSAAIEIGTIGVFTAALLAVGREASRQRCFCTRRSRHRVPVPVPLSAHCSASSLPSSSGCCCTAASCR